MDTRPADCRFRLQDEGKPYPRSSCTACGKSIMNGLGRRCTKGSPNAPDQEATFSKLDGFWWAIVDGEKMVVECHDGEWYRTGVEQPVILDKIGPRIHDLELPKDTPAQQG